MISPSLLLSLPHILTPPSLPLLTLPASLLFNLLIILSFFCHMRVLIYSYFVTCLTTIIFYFISGRQHLVPSHSSFHFFSQASRFFSYFLIYLVQLLDSVRYTHPHSTQCPPHYTTAHTASSPHFHFLPLLLSIILNILIFN